MRKNTADITYCAELLAYSAKVNIADGLNQVAEVSQKVSYLNPPIPKRMEQELLNLRMELSAIQHRIIALSSEFAQYK